MEDMVRDLWKAHYGDNSQDKPGIMLRVDRLERGQALAKWVSMTAVGAAIAAAVTSLKAKVFG